MLECVERNPLTSARRDTYNEIGKTWYLVMNLGEGEGFSRPAQGKIPPERRRLDDGGSPPWDGPFPKIK